MAVVGIGAHSPGNLGAGKGCQWAELTAILHPCWRVGKDRLLFKKPVQQLQAVQAVAPLCLRLAYNPPQPLAPKSTDDRGWETSLGTRGLGKSSSPGDLGSGPALKPQPQGETTQPPRPSIEAKVKCGRMKRWPWKPMTFPRWAVPLY